MPSALRGFGRGADEIRAAIEAFLKNCREPALLEPGEDPLPLSAENFSLDLRGKVVLDEQVSSLLLPAGVLGGVHAFPGIQCDHRRGR